MYNTLKCLRKQFSLLGPWRAGITKLQTSVWTRTEWWFCPEPKPISVEFTWMDNFHGALFFFLDRCVYRQWAQCLTPVSTTMTSLNWAYQIVCLPCMASAQERAREKREMVMTARVAPREGRLMWKTVVSKMNGWRNVCTFFQQAVLNQCASFAPKTWHYSFCRKLTHMLQTLAHCVIT